MRRQEHVHQDLTSEEQQELDRRTAMRLYGREPDAHLTREQRQMREQRRQLLALLDGYRDDLSD